MTEGKLNALVEQAIKEGPIGALELLKRENVSDKDSQKVVREYQRRIAAEDRLNPLNCAISFRERVFDYLKKQNLKCPCCGELLSEAWYTDHSVPR